MANGTTLFTRLVAEAESAYGNGVDTDLSSGGRRLLVSPTGIISLGEEWETGADRTVGVRNPIIADRATLTATSPEVSIEAPGVPTDELPIYLSGIQSATPTGTGPYVWTYNIGMTSSAAAPKSLKAIVADGNQSFFLNGILPTTLSLSAEAGGVTNLSYSGFAKAVSKTSQATAEGLPATTPRSMAGRVWRVYYDTAFPTTGGTAFDYVYDWNLEIATGLAPIFAQIGGTGAAGYNQFGAAFGGTLSLTVASNDAAVAQLLDKRGQATYWRLNWTDAGSPQHEVNIRLCAIPTSVEIISGDQDGITTYAVELALAYDTTAAKSVEIVVQNSLSTLP